MKRQIGIFALISLLVTAPVMAADTIGRVIFASGDVVAENNGATRALRRGAFIQQGDTIITSKRSRSQIRMKDGALFAVRPSSSMRFDQYAYDARTTSGNSLLNLIKGGFRTISGLVGKHSRQNYRVRTSVATIGVRGTHYGLTLCQQNDCVQNNGNEVKDGLYGSVVDGEIFTRNDAGEFTFANDEFFHIAGNDVEPRSLLRPPGVIFEMAKARHRQKKVEQVKAELKRSAVVQNVIEHKQDYIRSSIEQAVFEAGQDANNNVNVVAANPGETATFSFFSGTSDTTITPIASKVTADGTNANHIVLNAANSTTFIPVLINQTAAVTRTLAIADAAAADVGSILVGSDKIGWGRWNVNYLAAQNATPQPHQGALHYAFSTNTTSATELMALASMSVSKNYTSMAGTRATDLAGGTATDFANVQMSADFGAGNLNYELITNVSGIEYSASGTDTVGNVLNNGINLTDTTSLSGTSNTGTGKASLSFVGPQADAAISSYSVTHNSAQIPDGTSTANAVNGSVIMVDGASTVIPLN